MLSLMPVLRFRCSSVNIRCAIKLTGKNYVHNPWKCEYLQHKYPHNFYRIQNYSTTKNKEIEISQNSNNAPAEVTTFETIKENTKTAWFGAIVLAGFGMAAAIFYVIFKELFSSNSPSNIYSDAFQRCIKNEKVVFSLGEPIKGHGEHNSRGRRRFASHLIYEKDGVNYMRMKFYLKGSIKTATVHLEMKENESGKYEYKYLFVEVDGYSPNIIILEDNRS